MNGTKSNSEIDPALAPLPAGVDRLLATVPEAHRETAETIYRDHRASVHGWREVADLLRSIRLLMRVAVPALAIVEAVKYALEHYKP